MSGATHWTRSVVPGAYVLTACNRLVDWPPDPTATSRRVDVVTCKACKKTRSFHEAKARRGG